MNGELTYWNFIDDDKPARHSYYINGKLRDKNFEKHRRFWLRLKRLLRIRANMRKYSPVLNHHLYSDLTGIVVQYI